MPLVDSVIKSNFIALVINTTYKIFLTNGHDREQKGDSLSLGW